MRKVRLYPHLSIFHSVFYGYSNVKHRSKHGRFTSLLRSRYTWSSFADPCAWRSLKRWKLYTLVSNYTTMHCQGYECSSQLSSSSKLSEYPIHTMNHISSLRWHYYKTIDYLFSYTPASCYLILILHFMNFYVATFSGPLIYFREFSSPNTFLYENPSTLVSASDNLAP